MSRAKKLALFAKIKRTTVFGSKVWEVPGYGEVFNCRTDKDFGFNESDTKLKYDMWGKSYNSIEELLLAVEAYEKKT